MKELRACPGCFETFECNSNEEGGFMCDKCAENLIEKDANRED